MKALLALVLIVASLQVAYSITANFNTAYNVTTSVTDYSFVNLPLGGSLMDLNVSSAAATQSSTVSVSTYSSLPTNFSSSSSVSINNGLPAGYTTIGGSILTGSIGAGLYVNFSSDINGQVNAQLIINPTIFTLGFSSNLTAYFRPLYFDASTGAYYEFPTSQYTANANSGLIINFNRSTSIVLAIKLPNVNSIIVNINNNAVAYANLVANASATLIVNSALTLYNLTAATGNLAIGVSSYAASQGDNIIVSPIYSFTHSAGDNANVNVQLSYDVSNYNASIRANAAWYYNNNGNWERQSSSVNGNLVVYTTNHFSNWSVQSGSSGAGAKLEVPSFIKLLASLF